MLDVTPFSYLLLRLLFSATWATRSSSSIRQVHVIPLTYIKTLVDMGTTSPPWQLASLALSLLSLSIPVAIAAFYLPLS